MSERETASGSSLARLDSRDLASVAWLRDNACEASADDITATGRTLEAEHLATVVGNRVAHGDPRAAGAAVMPVWEALDRLGPLDVSDCETDAEVERHVREYLNTLVALAARTTHQRLAIWDARPQTVARALGVWPKPATRVVRVHPRRARPLRRRRRGGAARSGCSATSIS